MLEFLEGKRTYIVVILMIVYANIGLILGRLDDSQGVQIILEALAFAGLRAGIKKPKR